MEYQTWYCWGETWDASTALYDAVWEKVDALDEREAIEEFISLHPNVNPTSVWVECEG